MGPRHTADTQSSGSSIPGSTQTRSENIFDDGPLNLVLNAATIHTTKDKTGKQVQTDPREYTTVALWEDLLNKVWFKGYSNNSQWNPTSQTLKAMDIATFYFEETSVGLRKRSLCFTEAKRPSNAEGTKQGEGLFELEDQLGSYCKQWLDAEKPKPAQAFIYANAVCGPYIRVFKVTLGAKGEVVMTDAITGKPGRDKKVTKTDYLEVKRVDHQKELDKHFKKIRKDYPAQPGRPGSSGSSGPPSSRPGSQAGSAGAVGSRPGSSEGNSGSIGSRPGSAGDNRGSAGLPLRQQKTPSLRSQHSSTSGDPMSVDGSGSSPEREAARRRAGRPAGDNRSESPSDQPKPIRDRSGA